jgi:sphinganine-1-phosphate aldolase
MKMPEQGSPMDAVLSRLQAYRSHDIATHGGRTWAYVYETGRPDVEEVAQRAYSAYLGLNGLDFTVFPSLLQLENEVVSMAAAHLGGDQNVVGSFTSGGTESIILAVKTARDRARRLRPGIVRPAVVAPETAHAAFHKAAHYLDVDLILTPTEPATFKADPEAMAAAVTHETIMLVGSAVSYAHGVTDPIRELGEIALEHDLLLHVDACVGGFLLPYFRRLGAPVTEFDFTVPGVTSMSMDFHKYGYAPKGASVVLYRDKELRRHQFFVCADWPGYTVVNSTVQSSKSGGPLAAAWALLQYLGDAGYLELARSTLRATQRLLDGLRSIEGLRVLGEPEGSLVAFTSDTLNVFELIDEMRGRGWYIQPQLRHGGSKENAHISVDPAGDGSVDGLLAVLRECVAAVEGRGTSLPPELGAVLAALDPSSMSPEALAGFLEAVGIRDGRLPERMAPVNEVMNLLPKNVTEEMLADFVNDLFVHRLGE